MKREEIIPVKRSEKTGKGKNTRQLGPGGEKRKNG